jgi:hypothetical protein
LREIEKQRSKQQARYAGHPASRARTLTR